MSARVQRSMLILPVNNPHFVEKAYLRGADAIVLDLEDAVPPLEKESARTVVKDAILSAGRGGADVFVRINSEPEMLDADLEAAVHPGLHGIFLPKVEAGIQVAAVAERISKLENERLIESGHVKISLHVESPRGLLRLQEIATASPRAESMSLGVDDYCLHLGIEPSGEGSELYFPLCMMVTVCKAEGLNPMGIVGTVAGFKDTVGFEQAAERGREIGCTGAFCIHPKQVTVLNRVFSPVPEKMDWARRAVQAFEKGVEEGKAAVSLDGRMVDTPIYKQAKLLMERAAAIEEVQKRKADALRKIQGQ
ncbi:MAG: CoA ester lyase [Desulfomonilaceae bacterium]|nr:CoA ester lyase [Desulfomonilaceae bacterium]